MRSVPICRAVNKVAPMPAVLGEMYKEPKLLLAALEPPVDRSATPIGEGTTTRNADPVVPEIGRTRLGQRTSSSTHFF